MENIIQMTQTLQNLNRLMGGFASVILLATALVGLLQCFFGYKLMRLWFAVCGFCVGALACALACDFLDNPGVGLYVVAALVGGILGAILLFRVYQLGVFLTDAALVFLVFSLLLGTDGAALAVSAVCALVAGVLAVLFIRPWTILCTAVTGGFMAGSALAMLAGAVSASLPAGIVLAVLGAVVQWKTTAKPKAAAAQERTPTQAAGSVQTAAPAQTAAPVQETPVPAGVSQAGTSVQPEAAAGQADGSAL